MPQKLPEEPKAGHVRIAGMMRKQILFIVTVLIFASGFGTRPVHAQASSPIAGPWFGTIVLTKPDGTSSHDNAVLVVTLQTGTQDSASGSANVSGSMGRTIDQMTPWVDGTFQEHRLTFRLGAAGGLNVILNVEADQLSGSAVGKDLKAQINLRAAPGLLPHPLLQKEIGVADQQLYDAFGSCNIARYASLLSKDLEFYQDHTGRTGYDENVQALRDRCAEGIKLRRELDIDSLIVNAAPGIGAIQAGTQRFYSRAQDGQDHLDATARFTNVWSKQSGAWKLLRVISYDHR